MNTFFDQAFAYLLGDEGLIYTNNPLDSGGPTKFGITQNAYQLYLGRIVEMSEIKELSVDLAKKFYHDRYWSVLSCDKISILGTAIAIFDSGVLYGPGTAAILAQKTANACGANLKFDGDLGDKSVEFLNLISQEVFLEEFHKMILMRVNSVISAHPKNEVFRTGWTNRANRLLTLSRIVPVINETT